MKFFESGGEKQGEMIPDQSKEGVLPFLEYILNLFEAADIVPIQVDQHFFPIEFGPFKHPQFLTKVEVYPEESQMDVIVTLGQYCDNLIEL